MLEQSVYCICMWYESLPVRLIEEGGERERVESRLQVVRMQLLVGAGRRDFEKNVAGGMVEFEDLRAAGGERGGGARRC